MGLNPQNNPAAAGPTLHSLTYAPALRKAISGAEKRIWISIYVASFNFKKRNDIVHILFIILQQKIRSGVDVRIILDRPRKHKPNYHVGQFLIRRLKTWQIPFWLSPEKKTNHAKVVLIDDKNLFIGSHNLAKSSLYNPLELSVEISGLAAIKDAENWFAEKFKDPALEYFSPGDYNISDIYP